jgi:hypothetical protein
MKYILAVLVMTFSMQSTADNWLCIVDDSNGFSLKDGSWKPTLFEVGGKYMIKEASQQEKSIYGSVYQVNHFGDDGPNWLCGDFGSNEDAKELLVCEGFAIAGDTFKYNPSTGHFLATHTAGYVHTFDDGRVFGDTPHIQIGKCSKL